MDENITRGLFNPDSLTEASKGKVKAIDAYLIKENKLNEIYSQDDIDGLKENIWEFQLSQPIVVRKNKDGTYTIHECCVYTQICCSSRKCLDISMICVK